MTFHFIFSPSPALFVCLFIGNSLCAISGACWQADWACARCSWSELTSTLSVSCPEDSISRLSSSPCLLSASLLRCFLSLELVSTGVLFRAEHSIVTRSWYWNQFGVSALTAAHCRRKLLWPRLRAALIYRHNHRH